MVDRDATLHSHTHPNNRTQTGRQDAHSSEYTTRTFPSIKFNCYSCDFIVDCQYKGTKPPFAKQFVLHEDCFVMKDPFSTTGGFINVGAICSLCKQNVCMSSGCSLFYTQRFCIKCASDNIADFPAELHKEILKYRDTGDG